MSNDIPPELVPISPAATVILMDDQQHFSVLLLHRTSKAVFGPGFWVFPGGRVDPEDHMDSFGTITKGLTDEAASAQIQRGKGGLAWWVAACRETLEEAGLLLGSPETDGIDASALRAELATGKETFVELCLRHRIKLDLSGIEHIAHFTTPVGSPRRFDTQFFIARTPEGQSAAHDNSEIINSAWMTPSEALDGWRDGEIAMMPPTSRMLRCLERFDSADEVMAAARAGTIYHEVRVSDPNGLYDVILPGEIGYEQAETGIEFGATCLWEPNAC